MEQVVETLNLLKRQARIQDTLRHSDSNRVLAERELYLIQKRLTRYPATLQGDGQAIWPPDPMSGGTARTHAHGRAGRSLAKQGQRSVTVTVAASELHKPVDALSARDIEKLC